MSISVFKFGTCTGTSIRLPNDRHSENPWQPRINDKFPDFTAKTTKGRLRFSEWRTGSWVLLVSHPASFTPVCTTEISALARRHSEFEERHVKVIALTGDSLQRLQSWTAEIERVAEVSVPFPHISDENGAISKGCGLISREPLSDGKFCARRTLLIDPCGVVRMIMDYPLVVGRSVDEILRSIDALILSERLDAFTPSDWKIGDPLLLSPEVSQPTGKARGKDLRKGKNVYFRVIDFSYDESANPQSPRADHFSDIGSFELKRLAQEYNKRLTTETEADVVEFLTCPPVAPDIK